MNKPGDLRVWWIPQVPGKCFYVPVSSVEEAAKLLFVLADYDLFQYKNKIKPDYCNAGGLQVWTEDAWKEDIGDGLEKSDWCDWYDEETGEDDPIKYVEEKKSESYNNNS